MANKAAECRNCGRVISLHKNGKMRHHNRKDKVVCNGDDLHRTWTRMEATIMRCVFIDGLTPYEVGEKLGWPVSGIDQKIHNIIRRTFEPVVSFRIARVLEVEK